MARAFDPGPRLQFLNLLKSDLASISVGHFNLSHRRPLRLKRRGAFNRYIVARPVSNQNITGMNIGQIGDFKTGPESGQFRLRINY